VVLLQRIAGGSGGINDVPKKKDGGLTARDGYKKGGWLKRLNVDPSGPPINAGGTLHPPTPPDSTSPTKPPQLIPEAGT